MGTKQVQKIRASVDLTIIAIEGKSTFPNVPGLEPYHQMQFSFSRFYQLFQMDFYYVYFGCGNSKFSLWCVTEGEKLKKKCLIVWHTQS